MRSTKASAASKDLRRNVAAADQLVVDLDLVALNQIVKYKGRYYAYYHGSERGSRLWATNVAVSDDLIHWTKHRGALFPREENKSSGILVHDGKRYMSTFP